MVSLDGLSLGVALSGLLAIPNPEATKPISTKSRRKKAPFASER